MGKFLKGILGGFQGKVGTVVGSNWRGIQVMRSLPKPTGKEPSEAQLNQQEKFALVMGFMSGMASLLEFTFKAYANQVSGVNAAVSYNLQNAITGSASPFSLDYALALVSRGDLPNAPNATATAVMGNQVKFSWNNNEGIGKAKATDKAILVVYCPALKQTVYLTGGVERSIQQQHIDVSVFAGETVETWLAFSTPSGSTVSNSFYTGSVELLP